MSVVSGMRSWLRRISSRKFPRQAGHKRRLALEPLETRELLDRGLGLLPGLTDSPSAQYLTGLYVDLLHRVPQAVEVAGWGNIASAQAREAVANVFLSSTEYRQNLITDTYLNYLNREPAAAEVSGWLGVVQTGLDSRQLAAQFLASQEYFALQGGQVTGWLNGVYRDVLGRAADSGGLTGWSQAILRGMSRTWVAQQILNSTEDNQRLVTATYNELLERSPDTFGLASWVTSLAQGLTTTQFTPKIASSQEYYERGLPIPTGQAPPSGSNGPTATPRHMDFGTRQSPVATGYTRVTLPTFSLTTGYGWMNVTGMGWRDRGTADALTRDFVTGYDSTFRVLVPNGAYTITAALGDAKLRRAGISLWVNGQLVASNVSTGAGQFLRPSSTVNVSDGMIDVRLASTSTYGFALDAIDITPLTPAPAANAGPDASAAEGQAVSLSGSANGGTAPYSYSWSFGDGSSVLGTPTPAHTYADNGTYTVTLTVTDAAGQAGSDTAVVTVANVAPTATFGNGGAVNEGSTGSVAFSNPTDPSSADVTAGFKYSFDFNNDGTFEIVDGTAASATVPASYLADGPASRVVKGRIKDKDGGFSDYTTTITITNVAPVVSAGGPYSGLVGATIAFGGSATDVSPVDTAAGFTYAWNFGDGATSNLQNPSHAYAAAGSYTARLTVTDKDGGAAAATVNVTIAAIAGGPTANAGPDRSGNEGTAISFAGSVAGGTAPFTYSWSFGDGSTATGSLSPSHAYADNGSYTATLTVTDAAGQTSSDSAVAIVNNLAPTATLGNGGAVNEGSTGSVAFTAPTDPSSADVTAGFKYSFDFNNDGTFEIVDGTAASATVPASYLADGPASRVVKGRIKDKDGGFTDYTTTITVSNVAPSATFGNGGAVNEGSAGSVTFTAPTDPSSADVTAGFKYSFDFNNDGTFEIVDGTAASATVPASYLADGPTSRVVKGRIKDKDGGFTDYTTTITVRNVAPTVNAGGPYTGTTAAGITFSATVTDPSSVDTTAGFTYSWTFGDGSTSAALTPNHLYAAAGTYTATLTVTDKDGGVASASATVSVNPTSLPFPNNLTPPPLPAPTGTVIRASTVSQLQTAVANLRSGDTLLIDAGTYNLTGTLYLPQNLTNVAVRGATGRSDDVVVKGAGMSGTITFGFWVGNVQGVTFGDLTIRDFSQHGIVLNAGTQSPLIHNVHLIDIGDQFVKANPDGSGGGVNNGIVEYSTIEYSTNAPDYYTNGVDIHTGTNWIIRNNVFKNIRAQGALAGPAVLVWNHCSNVTTEANTFINNQREIAYGLDSATPNDNTGGIVRNNFVFRSASQGGDVAIGVWNSPNTKVLNNTVLLNGNYPNSVEYRFTNTTGVEISANLTDSAIVSRDGATGTVSGNVTNAQAAWFVNAAAGDLHLTSAATAAIDQAAANANVLADYDGQSRPGGAAPDIGADEYVAGSADTTPPAVSLSSPAGGATVSGTVAAAATASDNVGVAGVQFLLDGAPLGAEDTAAPYSVSWDTTATTNGSHTLSARARDAAGNQTTSAVVTVTVSNAPVAAPVANAGPDQTANEAASVSFSGSSTGGTAPLSYRWNFGDGATSAVASASHAYADNGTYTATLTVTDASSRSSTDTAVVTVRNVAPVPDAHGPYSAAPGAAIAFTGSAADPSSADNAAGFAWAWDFGDGGTSNQQNPSHVYGTAGTYSARLTVTDKDGGSASASASVTVGTAPVPAYIVTPYDRIPNFGANPTVVSAASGNWSSAANWSGGRVPGANDVVSIAAGTTVTYDATMANTDAIKTLVIQGGGKLAFRTDVGTTLYVSNLLVLQGGELDVGTETNPVASTVTAQIVFANKPLDTAVDPEQYGNGLVALGKVTMVGAAKPNTFIRLATEPNAGQTTLTLSQPATGWRAGDRVVLPDTRQLRDIDRGANYVSQLELLTVSAVSADGLTLTLSAALRYDHLGARAVNGSLDFLPHVMNITRNVVVKSESATGNRGHVLFTYRADVDVQYVQFAGLGRTKTDAIDNTTFGANGQVTHVGTNEEDRNPVQFRHLFGPTAPQSNGYQYTFIGSSIFCPLNPMPFVWGININDSHYGLIQDNVLYNWAGAGLVTKTGAESYNVIAHNAVVRTTGSSQRDDNDGQAGSGFWLHGPNNYVRDNVATNINGGGWDIYNYGFNIYARYLGSQRVPAYQGADPGASGQSVTVNMNATPIREFARNEVYGATTSGLSLWWIGCFDDTPYSGVGVSVVKDLRVWHHTFAGIFAYPTNNVTIDGLIVRGNAANAADPYFYGMGVYFNDYMGHDIVIRNANIQGLPTGIVAPYNVGRTPTMNTMLIQGGYLANAVNISVSPPRSVNGSGDLSPRKVIVQDVTFGHPSTVSQSRWEDISMDNILSDSSGTANLNVADLVYVYNYNGVATDDFQVFYSQRAPANATTRALIGGKVVAI